jgi:hypothetical protein
MGATAALTALSGRQQRCSEGWGWGGRSAAGFLGMFSPPSKIQEVSRHKSVDVLSG